LTKGFICYNQRQQKNMCGRNSAVECHLAKVDVDGSNPFARSRKNGGIAKWLRQRSAKPLFTGSNPVAASRHPDGVAETFHGLQPFSLSIAGDRPVWLQGLINPGIK
jgi:hypothetical protein